MAPGNIAKIRGEKLTLVKEWEELLQEENQMLKECRRRMAQR